MAFQDGEREKETGKIVRGSGKDWIEKTSEKARENVREICY